MQSECPYPFTQLCPDDSPFHSQRSYWIQIAQEFPGTRVWVIVFDTPYDVGNPLLSFQPSDFRVTYRSVLPVYEDVRDLECYMIPVLIAS